MRCTAPTRSGNPCRAFAVTGGTTCYLHSSPTAAKQAGSIGAQQRNAARNPVALQEFSPPMTALEVRSLLANVIIEVRLRKVDPRTANSIAILCSTLLKAIGESDFETRLRSVEAALQQKGNRIWKT